jgi:SAM-dependent methyltransferase
MGWFRRRGSNVEDLGLGLKPGAAQYRAYVGPPADYDLVAAMSFSLLVALGLRQHHRLLDVGCGSLRIGRLLIPYLNRGGYVGIEPNAWLVQEALERELGLDQAGIKAPFFHYSDSAQGLPEGARGPFDFALAQSLFSHTGPDLLERWLREIRGLLGPAGGLVATYRAGESDPVQRGWVYPDCVLYRPESLRAAAAAAGFRCLPLDWRHPRQNWVLLAAPGMETGWIERHPLGWNSRFDHGPR